MKKRSASVRRKTNETDVALEICLDGDGRYAVDTGLPFLNHMLELFSKHALIDLDLKAKGDVDVDYHHTVEDVGLAFGTALDRALGNRDGIARYGWSIVPMDECLSHAAVDLGGRPFLVLKLACRKKKILEFDLELIHEFFRAFVTQGRMNLHVSQLYGKEAHHAYESVFKAAARAMRTAVALDPRIKGPPSTKGTL